MCEVVIVYICRRAVRVVCRCRASNKVGSKIHEAPCSPIHLSTSMCPPAAACRPRPRVSRAPELPCPPQHLQVPFLSGVAHSQRPRYTSTRSTGTRAPVPTVTTPGALPKQLRHRFHRFIYAISSKRDQPSVDQFRHLGRHLGVAAHVDIKSNV